MKVLVDNFSVLAVERCMLSDLADILSPDIIIKLSDKEVYDLAAESETSALERHRATEELKVLEEGLTELNRFSRLRGADTSIEFLYLTHWQNIGFGWHGLWKSYHARLEECFR